MILLLAVLPSLAVAWLVPLGDAGQELSCAPDEAAHAAYVLAIAEGDFRAWPESSHRMSMYPPSLYAMHAMMLRVGRVAGDGAWQYRMPSRAGSLAGFPVARLASVALGAVSVWLIALAVLRLAGSLQFATAAGVIVALYPQRFFIDGYINADAFTLAAGAGLVFALVRWVKAGEKEQGVLALGVAAGFVLIGKPNGYALLPATLVWLGWAVACRRVSPGRCLQAAGVALAIATPLLAWNAFRNGGFDPLGTFAYRRFLASASWHGETGMILPDGAAWIFLHELARSSFMAFANMSRKLPAVFYLAWWAGLLVGWVRSARWVAAEPRDSVARRGSCWLVLTAGIGLAMVGWQSFFVDFTPQGRYLLLPAILVTLGALWAGGFASSRAMSTWLAGWCLLFLVASAWSIGILVNSPCDSFPVVAQGDGAAP